MKPATAQQEATLNAMAAILRPKLPPNQIGPGTRWNKREGNSITKAPPKRAVKCKRPPCTASKAELVVAHKVKMARKGYREATT